jgi:antitoxin VapB
MAILIKDPETDRIVRELAARTGETLTEAVRKAAEERTRSLQGMAGRVDRAKLANLLAEVRNYTIVDARPADEIIGYDAFGLPK